MSLRLLVSRIYKRVRKCPSYRFRAACVFALVTAAWTGAVHADVESYEEQYKLIKAPRAYSNFGADLAGDSINLYKDYLSTIPDYFSISDATMPYVWAGFEEYAKNGAKAKAVLDVGIFEKNTLFPRKFSPGSLRQAAGLPNRMRQVLELQLHGPEIITRKTYEQIYGPPAHSWSAYGDGWQPH